MVITRAVRHRVKFSVAFFFIFYSGREGGILEYLACKTGVIFLRFTGERGQARGEREVWDTRDGRGAKKITPARQPLFMLFRRSYMNAAIQLVISCHVIVTCYSTTKLAVAWSCSVDEAIQEVLRLFPNLPDVKEKQCIDLLLKSKDVQ